MFLDGTETDVSWTSSLQTFGHVGLYQDGTTGDYVVSFTNGVVLKLTVALEMMTVSIIMPADLRREVYGLMGELDFPFHSNL